MNLLPLEDDLSSLKQDLEALSQEQNELCVSIYMPTFRLGVNTLQNPTRFKNLLRKAAEKLEARGLSPEKIQAVLGWAHRTVEDYPFWQHQSQGLVAFLSEHTYKIYRLPFHVDELVFVQGHFYAKPLLPLLSVNTRFFLLALGQKTVRLYDCTRFSMEEMQLRDVPRSLEEALKYDETERAHHKSPGGEGRRAGGAPVFHAHGVDATDKQNVKRDVLRFMQMVSRSVHDAVAGQNAPLVIAALEYIIPIYQEANTYPHLLERGVDGNPEDLRCEEMHQAAWRIVEPYFQREEQDTISRYRMLLGRGLASNSLNEVVPAAFDGRIEALLVSAGAMSWGRFNPDTHDVEYRDERDSSGEDLVEVAAVKTFLKGGAVFSLDQEAMPDQAPVAAVYRY